MRAFKSKAKHAFHYSKGLSLVIEAIIVLIIITSGVIIVNIANSMIEEGKSRERFDLAREGLTSIDSVIRELGTEAPGAMRVVRVEGIEGSQFVVSGKTDTIRYTLLLPKLIFQEGYTYQEGNLLILSGPNVHSYEQDVDGDGSNDLVMENNAVLFAMKKLGTPGSHATINTTNLIVQMREKRTAVNVTPISLIAINDQHNSTYGTGWIEFARNESYLTTNSIRVVMNNTAAGISYIAEFSLAGANDFVEMQVKQITRY